LAIILAIIVFNTHVSALNAFGILVTLAGGAQYTFISFFFFFFLPSINFLNF